MATPNQGPLAYLFAGLAGGIAIGYFVGLGSSLNIVHKDSSSQEPAANGDAKQAGSGSEQESEGSDSEGAIAGEDLSQVKAGMFEECKMVLCVRQDLGMTKGKIAAQCSHATLACYKALSKSNPALLKHWERTGQAKIALKVDSEEDLLLLQATASSLGLCARSIQDAGRTQITAGSRTVVGIGPGPISLVNQVTGHLKLL